MTQLYDSFLSYKLNKFVEQKAANCKQFFVSEEILYIYEYVCIRMFT